MEDNYTVRLWASHRESNASGRNAKEMLWGFELTHFQPGLGYSRERRLATNNGQMGHLAGAKFLPKAPTLVSTFSRCCITTGTEDTQIHSQLLPLGPSGVERGDTQPGGGGRRVGR